jgi:methylase of polypeptide subunit release factors
MIRPAGGAANEMRVQVQGHRIDLRYTDEVRPTAFSLFLANSLCVKPGDRLACDLGVGGGILAIALAKLGVERVVAIDRSERACELAGENARRNGLADRLEVIHGELMELQAGDGFDLVVSNPPTMPESGDTPEFAVEGGLPAGETFVDHMVTGLASWLSDSGRAELALSSLVEEEVLGRFGAAGFAAVPRATLVAPFRGFYATAYGPERIDRFVAEGRALRNRDREKTGLSEFVTVYALSRARG